MNINSMDFSKLSNELLQGEIDKFNALHEIEGVKATMGPGGDNNTVLRIENGGNSTLVILPDMPGIDEPELSADEARDALLLFAENLEQIAKNLAAGVPADANTTPADKLGAPAPVGAPSPEAPDPDGAAQKVMSVLFDIFELMQILLKSAQQQKLLARDMRQQETDIAYAQQMSAAAEIRQSGEDAFKWGLAQNIISSTFTAISFGMSCYGFGKQLSNMKNESVQQTGLDMRELKHEMDSIKELKPSEITKEEMLQLGFTEEELAGKTAADYPGMFEQKYAPHTAEAQKHLDEAWKGVEDQKAVVQKNSENFDSAAQKCADQEKVVKTAEGDLKTEQGKLDDLNKDIAGKTKTGEDLQSELTEKTDKLQKLDTDIAAKEQAVKDLKNNPEANPEDVKKAEDELAAMKTEHDELEQGVLDTKGKIEANTKALDEAKAKVPAQENAVKEKESLLKQETDKLGDYRKDAAEAGKKLNEAQNELTMKEGQFSDAYHSYNEAKQQDLKGINDHIADIEKQAVDAAKLDPGSEQAKDANKELELERTKAAMFDKLMGGLEQSDEKQTVALKGLSGKFQQTKMQYTHEMEAMARNPKFIEGERANQFGQLLNSLGGTISGCINARIERDKATHEAKAKEIDAETERTRTLKDDAQELDRTAQQNIEKTLDIIANVNESIKEFNRHSFSPS